MPVSALSGLIVRVTSPLVLRIPGNAARKLHGFARAEAGSMLDLRYAAAASPSPARRALYLRHALDEARHARLFARAGDELLARAQRPPVGPPRAEPDGLWDQLGELRFLALVHRGEHRGRVRLEAFRAGFVADASIVAVFDAVLEDERRHETYTGELLLELAGSPKLARRALRRAAAWEAWRTFRRAGRALVEPLWAILSILTFMTLLPLALVLRRPVRGAWR